MIEKLPPEIFDNVISLYRRWHKANNYPWRTGTMLRPTLPALATVSRKFQDAVERHTFATLLVDIDFEDFERIMSFNRRSYVRHITFVVRVISREDLREQGDRELGYDTYRDREVRNRAFTDSLRRVWDFVHKLDASQPIDLVLMVATNPDGPTGKIIPGKIVDIFSLLDLTTDAGNFPALPNVRTFRIYHYSPLCFKDGQEIPKFIEYGTPDPVSCAVRALTSECTKIWLTGPFDASLFDPPSSVSGVEQRPCWQNVTMLCVKLDQYSPDGTWLYRQQEHRIPLRLPEGLVNCTQLPPAYTNTQESYTKAEEYYTDCMKRNLFLHHDFDNGSAYLSVGEVDDDDDDNDDETMLSGLDNGKLNNMIVAFARCCMRMPALQVAAFSLPPQEEDRNTPFVADYELFQVICIAAHWDCTWDSKMGNPSSTCKIYLYVDDWQPTSETMKELEKIGIEKYGQPSMICINTSSRWRYQSGWYQSCFTLPWAIF
ncbi:hypothetical protein NPX13_g3835 [Xylaria arbuscula]|uniref:F-box domain-containing protein n=1 Tax=Xylaria arbuscula TaxID=114810 RepID=A0A9W8NH08_9PEZI|nr:hypothetical protein NPX13_g3835 [Xylaria arbuscula]